jgi:hypothetical protein
LGDTCESDESWPFCETVIDGSFSTAKKQTIRKTECFYLKGKFTFHWSWLKWR